MKRGNKLCVGLGDFGSEAFKVRLGGWVECTTEEKGKSWRGGDVGVDGAISAWDHGFAKTPSLARQK